VLCADSVLKKISMIKGLGGLSPQAPGNFAYVCVKSQRMGDVMFSLSYLPSAERLTVVVVEARNLRSPASGGVLAALNSSTTSTPTPLSS